MTVALRERVRIAPAGDGGAPARRAVTRWAWRLFRREWRRQALILALLAVAVAATTVGLGVASNVTSLGADPVFGTANTIISVPGTDPSLTADIAALNRQFGPVDVVEHQSVPVPGSVSTLDMRAQNPDGPYGRGTLRLDGGRYPSASGEVAVTSDVAASFGLHLGGTWDIGGRVLRVVGLVENPLDLLDHFALVAPGQITSPTNVAILLDANQNSLQRLRLPSHEGIGVSGRGTGGKTGAEVVVLVLGTLGLLFVGLMAVAGFSVMAHRRMRALGMLGALGATDKHLRLVMLANGAAVGLTAAISGTAVGLVAWLAFVPTLRSLAERRIDSFALPWWAIATAALLTVVTAVAAAWWPARSMARVPIVAALSGRPPRPQPAHRFAAAGLLLTATGVVLLAFADGRRVGFVIIGTLATAIGILFVAPLAIRAVAAGAGHTGISVRLALRDLARFQARSGAALGAVTLAVGISATIAISASASESPTAVGNLAPNEIMLYLSPTKGGGNVVPPLSSTQQQTVGDTVGQLAKAVRAESVVALDQAYVTGGSLLPPQSGGPNGQLAGGYAAVSLARVTQLQPNGVQISTMLTVYVATPEVLAHYGIPAATVEPAADILSTSSQSGLQLFSPDLGTGRSSAAPANSHPDVEVIAKLPRYSSDPGVLITEHGMRTLGLSPIPSSWLIETPHRLTPEQIATARKDAADAGMYIETRTAQKSVAPLRNWSTAAGLLLALGVLGMTVGLIRSETASDLRTLTATGAASTTRRTLTGATAGALALLGALIGTAGAYAALLAWHRSDLSPLGRVPVANLLVIIFGLPVVAAIAGWLLAGREPPAISRRPLE